MKGIWKKILIFGAVAGVGYLGYKTFRIVNDISKLTKTLPDFLKDILDEKPKVNINIRLNSLSIAIGLSSEAYENIDIDLDDQIQNYIIDYYPNLAKLKITTQKYIKSSVDEDDELQNKADNVADYETVDVDEDR